MKLTKFQKHISKLLHALGPIDYSGLQAHTRQPRKAIQKAVYRLRCLGLSHRFDEHRHDTTLAGKRLNVLNQGKTCEKAELQVPF